MKVFKKLFSILIVAVMAVMFLPACGNGNTDDGNVACENITFRATGYDEGKTLYIEIGKEVTIVGTVSPANATVKKIEWSSDNSDIGVVSTADNKAKITAYDVGKAKVTAACGDYKKVIDVECVSAVLPTGLTTSVNAMTVPVMNRQIIEYEIMPENATNKAISCTIAPLGDAQVDMVDIKEENGDFYVVASQLAAAGDQYLVTVRAVANQTLKQEITVTVGTLEVESMQFKVPETTISLSDPVFRALPMFKPQETSFREVDFVSSDENICKVSDIGTLLPQSTGTVTITAINKHNKDIKCEMSVTVTDEESEYITRLVKKSDVDALEAKDYQFMDFENDKEAFASWKKVLSEDSNGASHISDAGWAIWMVGFDTYDDDNEGEAQANALVYCKLNVPQDAKKMQYVFKAHPMTEDRAKFKILAIKSDYSIVDCSGGWQITSDTTDKFIDIDVSAFAGQAVTFVVMQDQIGNKEAGNYMGVSLMFRRCLFDTANSDRWVTDPMYSILGAAERN